jgi:hypothetical protein
MKNKIEDLRNILFDQLAKVQESELDALDDEIKRSASMLLIATTIVDSARAENEFLSVVKGTGSGFIPVNGDTKKLPE